MRNRASEAAEPTWQSRLVEAMEARGLSGGELARRAGFTAQYVNSLKNGDRGARLTIETARKLAAALGVSVDWLVKGEGARERLSDVFPVASPTGASASPKSEYRIQAFREPSGSPHERDPYPSRGEAIALLASVVAPEVIDALRAVVPDGDADPGRAYWISAAKSLARDFRRIKDDPDLGGGPPRSSPTPLRKK